MVWSLKLPQPVDVDNLLRRASRRVWLRGLEPGAPPLKVLSRKVLDRMIRQAISEVVERLRSEGAQSLAQAEVRLATDSRRELDALLQKIQDLGVPGPEEDIFVDDGVGEKQPGQAPFEGASLELGRGLDLGTSRICASARSRQSGHILYSVQPNAFLEVHGDRITPSLLNQFGIDCVVRVQKTYLLGKPAVDLAMIFEKSVRHPLKDNSDSGMEPDGALLVQDLLERILGHSQNPGEICVYSIPADPADGGRNFIYHRGVLEHALGALGYAPQPMIDSHVIIQDEFRLKEFTGIGMTCGAGMINLCVACKGVPALTLSTSRGGDWVDQNVARALGVSAMHVQAVKE